MFREKLALIGALCALSVVAACSKSQAASAASKDPAATPAADASSSDDDSKADDPPLDCQKIFTPADAAGILIKPATVGSYDPFPRSCIFDVPGAEFRVHTGTDFTSEMGWNEMSNSANSSKYTPLPNVGDRAFYRIDNSLEFMSKKGKMYCSVQGSAFSTGDFTSDRGAALATKVGALCTKMFAAG
ncbi:MAG: hypothetical protein ABI446_04635 [Gemmatimonadaceae bacterium]